MPWSPGFLVGLPQVRRVPGLGFGLRHVLGGQAGTVVLLVILLVVLGLMIWARRNR